ncbi:WcaF family extracellular polysaccharide biosynthesis acetyltransferase [Mesorhizobium sp. M0984]|uniref:WcaF family extracellular polysaccharide biosynthesis acetyltransferase n=1 Tax=Mesorhizobium sp. M0984 TaxID=2957041 RepID=UPI00333C70FD
MRLSSFQNSGFSRGRSAVVETIWLIVSAALVSSFVPGSTHRRIILRWFGGSIGTGVVIKPGVKIKFPWKLIIGQDCWLGEGVWIDNVEPVVIGSNTCISQGAYVCTGNHDWSALDFSLVAREVTIGSSVWIGAKAIVGPGSHIEDGVVLGMGSVATGHFTSWNVFSGNPAAFKTTRKIAYDRDDAS